jgi:dihydroxyacetone kinase-like predicted kinase
MNRYYLEFILQSQNASSQDIKNSIIEFGEDLKITDYQDGTERHRNFKIQIFTQDPTIIFDTCAQFGRIKSVKIDDGEQGKG